MKIRNATNLLTNKTSIKVIRFWAVYNGQSMMIDNDGNQSYKQDWDSFECFGFDYYSTNDGDCKTDMINRDDITELEYDNLLLLADKGEMSWDGKKNLFNIIKD
jgi:hypothetical protein